MFDGLPAMTAAGCKSGGLKPKGGAHLDKRISSFGFRVLGEVTRNPELETLNQLRCSILIIGCKIKIRSTESVLSFDKIYDLIENNWHGVSKKKFIEKERPRKTVFCRLFLK